MTFARFAPLGSALALCLAMGCEGDRYLVGTADALPTSATTVTDAGASPTTPVADASPATATSGTDTRPASQDAGLATPLVATPVCPVGPAAMPVRPLRISREQAADRVARFLWDERADPSLVQRAQTLATSADVATLARSMLTDGRAPKGVQAFVQRWMDLSQVYTRSGEMFEPTTEVRQAMVGDIQLFATEVVLGGKGLEALLTGTFTPSKTVATAINDSSSRSGIFAQPGWLFTHARATARGASLREMLFCEQIPAPPANVDLPPPPPKPGLRTYRELLEASVEAPQCSPCHVQVDPMGFAFERFDPIGRSRTTDNGAPIDATGMVAVPQGPVLQFDGELQLMQSALQTCQVQTCFARAYMEHALGGRLRPEESASVREVAAAFLAGNLRITDLMMAVVQSEAFLAP